MDRTEIAMRLDGRTALLGIIGDPVAQVKAPAPLTQALQQRGFNAVLLPLHVGPQEVERLLAALWSTRNFAGLVVTVPHKQRVAALGTVVLAESARRAGAANVLRRGLQGWEAGLLDGQGFVAGLRAAGFDARGRTARIVGAGGAASAIAFALADAGVRELGILDLDRARSEALIAQLRRAGLRAVPWDGRDAAGADLLVNATPAGMQADDLLPVPPDALREGLWVAEVIMAPAITPLLALARERGCHVHEGRHMLERQIGLMVDFFAPALEAMQ